jgi:hypothetical protein
VLTKSYIGQVRAMVVVNNQWFEMSNAHSFSLATMVSKILPSMDLYLLLGFWGICDIAMNEGEHDGLKMLPCT